MQKNPIYEVSYTTTIALLLLIVVAFGLAAVGVSYQAAVGGGSWWVLLIPLAFLAVSIPPMFSFIRRPVRDFSLFEDRIRIKGASTNIDRPYSDLTEISLLPRMSRKFGAGVHIGHWPGADLEGVRFRIRGESKEFELPNHLIPVVDKSLYSWLVEKSKH